MISNRSCVSRKSGVVQNSLHVYLFEDSIYVNAKMIAPELNERVSLQVQRLVKTVAEEEGFRDYKIEKTSTGAKGDGYMGIITSVSIIGTTKSDENKVVHLVIKSAPTSDALRKEAPISDVYAREIFVYENIFPAFFNFSIERKAFPFSSFAKCYKTCLENKSEALILENLKEAGYRLWDKKIPMNHEHLSFVMAEYGRLHALSFAMRDLQPERFQKLVDDMDKTLTAEISEEWTKMFKNRAIATYDALDPVADKHALEVFQAFAEKEMDAYIISLFNLVDDHSVILHGDSWVNNMMFKYENTNALTKPINMCFIDLQLTKLGPAVLDLVYFFYTSANKTSIDNYEDYLDVYYNSLSAYMRKLGSNPEKLYPHSVFRQKWNEHAKYGLAVSMILIHVMLTDTSEAIDFSEVADSGKTIMEAFNYSHSNVHEYNDRIRHLILHFVDKKLIQ